MWQWIRNGTPWIWLTGGAVSFSLLSVLGLLLLIGWKGLTYFWPSPLTLWQVEDSNRQIVGQIYRSEDVAAESLRLFRNLPEYRDDDQIQRLHIKVANRDIYPSDFIALLNIELSAPAYPTGWAVIERVRHGQFFAKPIAYQDGNETEAGHLPSVLTKAVDEADEVNDQIDALIADKIQVISHDLELLRLEKRRKELNSQIDDDYLLSYQARFNELHDKSNASEAELNDLKAHLKQKQIIVEDMYGERYTIPLADVIDIWFPNDMGMLEKTGHWLAQVWHFMADSPRESNSEGGVFPAIFGTVLLVILMAIIVMPLGVISAVYLHEYAKDNAVTRIIRVAVINLAGVPSIVYGVFGLGFFVYNIGSSIDELFYSERLPSPTFGTPGLLWSALTLAVLTLPVVIVATEEGLTRIPVSVRHGSLALGATQSETIWRIVLPMASPAIITGLILAIARAAGEVAPLMLVGVAKLVSSLPVDMEFPYLHLDRKFMHLGFHIYDVGFQTSNIEAARPLVYATSFLLVAVIVALNLTAIRIRNNLREKYKTMGLD